MLLVFPNLPGVPTTMSCFLCRNQDTEENTREVYTNCNISDGRPCTVCVQYIELELKILETKRILEQQLAGQSAAIGNEPRPRQNHTPLPHRNHFPYLSTFAFCRLGYQNFSAQETKGRTMRSVEVGSHLWTMATGCMVYTGALDLHKYTNLPRKIYINYRGTCRRMVFSNGPVTACCPAEDTSQRHYGKPIRLSTVLEYRYSTPQCILSPLAKLEDSGPH